MDSNKDKGRFNNILIEAIIEGLDFGEVILRFLELKSGIDRNRIIDKPNIFAEELRKTFGPWTARIFEKNILGVYALKPASII